jgi:hypothetical protein
VPDWDNTERERDEDAAWRDLVARFDAPLTTRESIPWPEREDMPRRAAGPEVAHEAEDANGSYGPDGGNEPDGERAGHAADGDHGSRRADGWRTADRQRATDGRHGGLEGFGADGVQGPFDAAGTAEAQDPDVIETPRRIRGPGGRGIPGRETPARGTSDGDAAALGTPADDDGDHFIPPAPPPLPRLDPLAKGAWAALFGGPGYLVVATAADWSVSGLAAFCAVAAFVAGFAILVLRMNEPDPKGPSGPDDGDDGAVV